MGLAGLCLGILLAGAAAAVFRSRFIRLPRWLPLATAQDGRRGLGANGILLACSPCRFSVADAGGQPGPPEVAGSMPLRTSTTFD